MNQCVELVACAPICWKVYETCIVVVLVVRIFYHIVAQIYFFVLVFIIGV